MNFQKVQMLFSLEAGHTSVFSLLGKTHTHARTNNRVCDMRTVSVRASGQLSVNVFYLLFTSTSFVYN